MASVTKADGWQAAGQGIGNLFQAFVQGPMLRQQAQQDAALKNAQTYSHNMHGNKYGAEAQGQMMTNEARTAPIDASLPQYMQAAQKLFSMTGDTNMDRFASAGQRLQQMGAADTVMANPATAATIGTAMAAAAGKGAYNAVGNSGVSVNQFTGDQTTTHPGLYSLTSGVSQSQANQNNMQAAAAREAAGLRRLQAQGQALENRIGSHDAYAVSQGQPLPSTRKFVGNSGGSSATIDRARASTIQAIINDPTIAPEDRESAIANAMQLFDNFMGVQGGGAPAAPKQAATPAQANTPAPAAQQGGQGSGKTVSMAQINHIAKTRGLSVQQVRDQLRGAGYRTP